MNVKSSVATAIVFYHDTVYVCGVIIMIIIMKDTVWAGCNITSA